MKHFIFFFILFIKQSDESSAIKIVQSYFSKKILTILKTHKYKKCFDRSSCFNFDYWHILFNKPTYFNYA